MKWAGGKRSLLQEILHRTPDSFGTYWEPFVGGGALFFALESQLTRAYLSDINPELVLTYKVVRDHVEDLIALLDAHAACHSHRAYYASVRKMHDLQEPVEVAARFIYLNKTCYNGLYRVNKKGIFNVPKGSYINPKICDAANLRHTSRALGSARIRYGDFQNIDPAAGDFVYCDPPYDGASVAYAPHAFGDEQQLTLRDTVARWARRGVNIMVSNSDTPLIRALYGANPFRIHEVSAPRNINSNGNGRGKVAELIITTYG